MRIKLTKSDGRKENRRTTSRASSNPNKPGIDTVGMKNMTTNEPPTPLTLPKSIDTYNALTTLLMFQISELWEPLDVYGEIGGGT